MTPSAPPHLASAALVESQRGSPLSAVRTTKETSNQPGPGDLFIQVHASPASVPVEWVSRARLVSLRRELREVRADCRYHASVKSSSALRSPRSLRRAIVSTGDRVVDGVNLPSRPARPRPRQSMSVGCRPIGTRHRTSSTRSLPTAARCAAEKCRNHHASTRRASFVGRQRGHTIVPFVVRRLTRHRVAATRCVRSPHSGGG